MNTTRRIGLIVPSSNVTVETEVPELLLCYEDGERCAAELADAECDVLAYACLVAVMVSGPGAHQRAESTLRTAAGGATSVVTSAGALIDGIHALGAERVAMITPYAPPLTAKVVDYLADAGIEVVDSSAATSPTTVRWVGSTHVIWWM